MTPDPSVRNTPTWHFGPKHVLFGVLGLLTLFVVYNNERFIVDHSDPLLSGPTISLCIGYWFLTAWPG